MNQETTKEIYFKSYSDETAELLSKPHTWLVKSGSGIILTILVLALVVSHFIRYPELAVSPVVVYGNDSKASLFAKTQSRIVHLHLPQETKANEILMVLESTTDWQEAIKLEKYLQQTDSLPLIAAKESLPSFYQLGTLQPLYENYKSVLQTYQLFLRHDALAKKANTIEREIAIQEQLNEINSQKIALEKRNYEIAKEKYKADSMLFASQAIAKQEFLQSKSAFLSSETRFIQQQELTLNAALRINQLRQELASISIQNQEKIAEFTTQIQNARTQLKKALQDWKLLYVIESPIAGRLTIFNPLNLYQTVSTTDELLAVVPNKQNAFAYAKIEAKYIAKLRQNEQNKTGNSAKIKLDAYPFMRYGWLDAKVTQISLAPQEDKYTVKLLLENDFITNRGVEINKKPELSGSVEIVLEERSLLDKFLEQTVYSVDAAVENL